jgi:hypothetical protein
MVKALISLKESSWTAKWHPIGIQPLSYAEFRVMEKVCTIQEKKCLLKKKAARINWRPGKFLPSRSDRSRQSF